MVVVGTRRGHIRFYDRDMCLLHWYQQAELDAIASLGFHLDEDTTKPDFSWVGSRCSFPTGWHPRFGFGARNSQCCVAGPVPFRRGRCRARQCLGNACVPAARLSVDAEQRGVQDRVDLSRLISGPSPRGRSQGRRESDDQLQQDQFQARDLIVSEFTRASLFHGKLQFYSVFLHFFSIFF